MRIKIVVEECATYPPTEVLLDVLRRVFMQAPPGVKVEIVSQRVPEGILPGFTERLRCAINQVAITMHGDNTLYWGVYIILTQMILQNPMSGVAAFSRDALIVAIRSRSGVEWELLKVIGGDSLPERARAQIVQEHQGVIEERGMDRQHATEEEIAIAEELMQEIHNGITAVVPPPSHNPGMD